MSDSHAWQSSDDDRASSAPVRTMADLLFLPESERTLLNWLLRQRTAALAEIAAFLNQSEQEAEQLVKSLVAQGFVQTIQTTETIETSTYQPMLKIQKERKIPGRIWDVLE